MKSTSPLTRALVLLAPLLLVVSVHSAHAAILASHVGNVDPTTEGWAYNSVLDGPNTDAFATNDGIDTWAVVDSANNDALFYRKTLSGAEALSAQTFGWSFKWQARAVNQPDNPDGGVSFEFRDGINRWEFEIGSQTDGDQILEFVGNGATYVSGGGNNYHDYEVIYDAASNNIDVFVDNVAVASMTDLVTSVSAGGQSWIRFGAASSVSEGRGHYSFVQFETLETAVPSPSPLLIMGSLLFAGMVRRKRGWNSKQAAIKGATR